MLSMRLHSIQSFTSATSPAVRKRPTAACLRWRFDALAIKEPGTGEGEAPAKECPECQVIIAAGFGTCPECGHEFPPPDREQHEAEAGTAGVLSGQIIDRSLRSTYLSVPMLNGRTLVRMAA